MGGKVPTRLVAVRAIVTEKGYFSLGRGGFVPSGDPESGFCAPEVGSCWQLVATETR